MTNVTLAELSLDWFRNDPTGRMIAVGVLVIVGLVVLFYVLRAMKWAAAHIKPLMIGAIVIGLAVWGVSAMELTLGHWIAIGFISFCMFLGWALYMTQRK